MYENKLAVIDGETLMDMRLPPGRVCVAGVLPQGVVILGGAPKIGKSWMVMDLCVSVAKGSPIWGMPTAQGATLYLCLEDTLRRVQERLNRLTDEAPANAFFAVAASTLDGGLCLQIADFVNEHPDTVLIAVDTLQMIRGNDFEASYANDYLDIRKLKELADRLGICLLLVHHLRKQGDRDPLHKLSGTTGVSGAADAVLVLDKSQRSHNRATLVCMGRDIEYRELELELNGDACRWELISDSLEQPGLLLPPEMTALVDFMRHIETYHGGNSEFAERLNAHAGLDCGAKRLKQLMNQWRFPLEDNGVHFKSYRSNGQRWLDVRYFPVVDIDFTVDASDASDAKTVYPKLASLCDPCVPVCV